jgi:hypothetical protein
VRTHSHVARTLFECNLVRLLTLPAALASRTTGSGQLFDVTNQACVSAQPDESQWATAARMLAAEQDISGIETQLDQTGGNHSVCTICQLNQYVSEVCTATVGTRCANCSAGSYSRGGYTEQCIACADNVQQCGYATCTSSTDSTCQFCSQTVENGAAFIVSASNTCTQCSLYTYRSSNTTCTACPKDNTVSSAILCFPLGVIRRHATCATQHACARARVCVCVCVCECDHPCRPLRDSARPVHLSHTARTTLSPLNACSALLRHAKRTPQHPTA